MRALIRTLMHVRDEYRRRVNERVCDAREWRGIDNMLELY